MPISESKTCPRCSTPFVDRSPGQNRGYCSHECRNQSKRERGVHKCGLCGKPSLKEICFRHTRIGHYTRDKRRREGLCWRCGAAKSPEKLMCEGCIVLSARQHREQRQKLRDDFMDFFGNACACCGETHNEFLTLDHIKGRTPNEKWVPGSSYRFARNEGYPKDKYRILCFNCNCSRGFRGYCPHERERESENAA